MLETILSISLSALTAIIAIIVPLLTLKVQKKSELKKLQIEEFYKTKLRILEELMIAYSEFSLIKNNSTINRFVSCLNKALLVSSRIIRNSILVMMDNIKNADYQNAEEYFHKYMLDGLGDEIDETREEIMLE